MHTIDWMGLAGTRDRDAYAVAAAPDRSPGWPGERLSPIAPI